MTVRFHSLPAMVSCVRAGRLAAAVAFAFALSGAGADIARAATTDAASVPAVVESDAQYTVRPGQSLNDIAIALTQSHDRATLARASKAIFDANPNAFMGHDPSRMRLGAVLNVPSLDTLGVVASAPVAGSATAGASGSVAGSASAAASAVSASPALAASASTSATITPPSSASQAAAANTATVNGASVPTGASAAVASSVAATGASQPAEPSAQPLSTASGAHVWTGAIQSASTPSEGASAAVAPATTAVAPQVASQARTSVSSLQQLLALKNRVLMELQKHGIVPVVKAPQAGSAAAAPANSTQQGNPGAASASAATASSAVVAGNVGAGAEGMSPELVAGIAAAVAAVIALILSLTVWRRRRPAANAAGASPVESGVAPSRGAAPAAPRAKEDVQAQAFPPVPHDTLEGATGSASLAAAAGLGAEALPLEQIDPASHALDEDEGARYIGSGARDDAAYDTEAAEETPQHIATVLPAETAHVEAPGEHIEPAAHAEPVQPVLDASPRHAAAAHAEAPASPVAEPDARVAADVHHDAPIQHAAHDEPPVDHEAARAVDVGAHAPLASAEAADLARAEPQFEEKPFGSQPPVPELDVASSSTSQTPFVGLPHATEFPRAAAAALGSLDMSLPPRTESSSSQAPAATQPVAEPDATARQAFASPPVAPRVADEIGAGTAGSAAIAGLGAMPFGALKLDFDLELPPGPAQSLPAFTQEDLAKIARNKLELAAEYIELGDLSGARALVHEVIESNDASTRNEARALLSTLAPLS
ncbi:FimV/HubP family polar landmark protein [Paraburkholderia sp. GAS334]|uniref:FimV/HubP family polar landmark protein n=1 Tax=Paraburkholderia sp. GAS334 TaxID=3035131 RepID=UPI003D1A0B72